MPNPIYLLITTFFIAKENKKRKTKKQKRKKRKKRKTKRKQKRKQKKLNAKDVCKKESPKEVNLMIGYPPCQA